MVGISERYEFALTLSVGGFFAVVGGLSYAGDRPALAVLHLAVGLIVVILALVRYDAARRGEHGNGLVNRFRRRVRKIPFNDESGGIGLPTSRDQWRRWSKPRRRWFIGIPAFAALGFVLAVLRAPTWSLITAFAAAFLCQAPVLYYEVREDRR